MKHVLTEYFFLSDAFVCVWHCLRMCHEQENAHFSIMDHFTFFSRTLRFRLTIDKRNFGKPEGKKREEEEEESVHHFKNHLNDNS